MKDYEIELCTLKIFYLPKVFDLSVVFLNFRGLNSYVVIISNWVPVTGITLNMEEVFLFAMGGNAVLVPSITPKSATNQNIKWTSSNESVATITVIDTFNLPFIVINPIAAGTTTITATTESRRFQATCKVTVIVPPASVSLNHSELMLKKGESDSLQATVKPANATNKNVSWESSNPEILAVDSNGKLTALASGVASVSVTTEDLGYTDVCKVIVVEEGWNVDKETDVQVIKPDSQDLINFAKSAIKMKIKGSNASGVITAKRYNEEERQRPGSSLSLGQYLSINRCESLAGVTITVYISFDPSLLPKGMDKNKLKLYRYNEEQEKWIAIANQEVNEAENYIRAEVDEFSVFGIFNPVLFGDVTGEEKKVNVSDAITVLRNIVGLSELNEFQKIIADVNGDGTINVSDAILILRRIVGLLPKFPVD